MYHTCSGHKYDPHTNTIIVTAKGRVSQRDILDILSRAVGMLDEHSAVGIIMDFSGARTLLECADIDSMLRASAAIIDDRNIPVAVIDPFNHATAMRYTGMAQQQGRMVLACLTYASALGWIDLCVHGSFTVRTRQINRLARAVSCLPSWHLSHLVGELQAAVKRLLHPQGTAGLYPEADGPGISEADNPLAGS